MTDIKRALAAILMVALSLSWLPASAEDLRGQVREVSKLLEIPRGLELASAKVQKNFRVEGSAEAQAKAQEIIRGVFSPLPLRIAVEQAITQSGDATTLGAAIRFLNGPLARKLSTLERQAQPNVRTQIQSFAAGLSKNPPPPARVELVQRIIRATHHVESATMTSIDPLVAVGAAVSRECGGKGDTGGEAAKLHDLQVAKIRESAPVVMLFLYEAASDAELKEYADWFESQDGRKFIAITMGAIENALNAAAERAGRRIGREVMKGKVAWCKG